MSPPFKLCHGSGTSNEDDHARKRFNKEYNSKLIAFEGVDKCLHCDCYINTNCNHVRCEKEEICRGNGCNKVAAHCYKRIDGYMLLVRTCRSCNSSSGCFNIDKSRNGKTLVFKLDRKVSEYEL